MSMSLVTPWHTGGGQHEAVAKEVDTNWPGCWASIQMGNHSGCSLAPTPSSWPENKLERPLALKHGTQIHLIYAASDNIKKGVFEDETLQRLMIHIKSLATSTT